MFEKNQPLHPPPLFRRLTKIRFRSVRFRRRTIFTIHTHTHIQTTSTDTGRSLPQFFRLLSFSLRVPGPRTESRGNIYGTTRVHNARACCPIVRVRFLIHSCSTRTLFDCRTVERNGRGDHDIGPASRFRRSSRVDRNTGRFESFVFLFPATYRGPRVSSFVSSNSRVRSESHFVR